MTTDAQRLTASESHELAHRVHSMGAKTVLALLREQSQTVNQHQVEEEDET